MTAYQRLKDCIEQKQTQGICAYMEMRTGISRDFIRLELDAREQIKVSFSVPCPETSPYYHGVTITPEWDVLEKSEGAKNIAVCLGGFAGQYDTGIEKAELQLHQHARLLPTEYFPKYSYGDLETGFIHLLNGCAMSKQSESFLSTFHGHPIEIQTDPETQTIRIVAVDEKETYNAVKGTVNHKGIAGLMANALCESLFREGMYDCERTFQEFDERYGISQLNEQGKFDKEAGSGPEINWMNDLMFDPIDRDEWEH